MPLYCIYQERASQHNSTSWASLHCAAVYESHPSRTADDLHSSSYVHPLSCKSVSTKWIIWHDQLLLPRLKLIWGFCFPFLDGCTIEHVSSYKYLGIYIDTMLMFFFFFFNVKNCLIGADCLAWALKFTYSKVKINNWETGKNCHENHRKQRTPVSQTKIWESCCSSGSENCWWSIPFPFSRVISLMETV